MEKHDPILIAGSHTLIGRALAEECRAQGFSNLVAGDEPGWADRQAVRAVFARTRPAFVFLAAGQSAGILGNQTRPADLILDNLLAECHVVHAAHEHRVRKLLYLASSCCYPKRCPQPMKEEFLLTGPLEPTNEAYAVAKIAGMKLCEAYRKQHGDRFVAGIPANAFGPGDDFSPGDSHVIAALLRRFHEAKERGDASVAIWGTGTPRREFIYAPDLASACLHVMQAYDDAEPINLGCGTDMSIAGLARAVADVTGFGGEIAFDPTRPDGMPVKLLDSRKLESLGWRPRTAFDDALRATYRWFLAEGNTPTP